MFDIQERLTAFAMLGATWVMWLLIFLSVIGVAIIFERIYY
jgi:biopolymer transport protein ExbB/TolQ